jgi:hypothetical protein
MLKPKFLNIIFFLFVKYLVFACVLAFGEGRFKLLVILNSNNRHELFVNSLYYLLYVIIVIFLFILIFSIPIYFVFKIRNAAFFSLLMITILILEYLLYIYLGSQKYVDIDAVYNSILTVLFLFLFFFKHIRSIFKIT